MRRKIPKHQHVRSIRFGGTPFEVLPGAADELSFTESAISRKIALLEEYLGVKLFSRVKKRLQLTDAGKSYSLMVQKNLDQLEIDTTLTMAHDAGRIALELAVLPTFALKWLIPRLS